MALAANWTFENDKGLALRTALLALAAASLAACAGGPKPQVGVNGEPTSHYTGYKVGKPYEVKGVWYYPKDQPNYDEIGIASWYGEQFHNHYTADGEVFDMAMPSAAHKTLPLPSLVEVTNLANGRTVIVRVNDRGPFVGNRVIDMSKAAADELGFVATGVTKVRVRYVGQAPPPPEPKQTQALNKLPKAPSSLPSLPSLPALPPLAPPPMAPPPTIVPIIAPIVAPILLGGGAAGGLPGASGGGSVPAAPPVTQTQLPAIQNASPPSYVASTAPPATTPSNTGLTDVDSLLNGASGGGGTGTGGSSVASSGGGTPAAAAPNNNTLASSAAAAMPMAASAAAAASAAGSAASGAAAPAAAGAPAVAPGGLAVQAGVFSNPANAAHLAERLAGSGAPQVEPFERNGQTLYRVVVRGLPNQTTAQAAASRAVSLGAPDAHIIGGL